MEGAGGPRGSDKECQSCWSNRTDSIFLGVVIRYGDRVFDTLTSELVVRNENITFN